MSIYAPALQVISQNQAQDQTIPYYLFIILLSEAMIPLLSVYGALTICCTFAQDMAGPVPLYSTTQTSIM
jgi:hypothetical protein